MRDTVDPMIQKHLEVPRTWVGHMKFPKKRNIFLIIVIITF